MTLHVHIDRLVIDATDGPALDRTRLEDAIRRELAERIAADGLPAQLRVSSARDTLTGSATAGNADRSHGVAPRAQDRATGAGGSAAAARTPGHGIGHALYGSFHR